MEMRRKELAVTDPKELDEIILSCDCLRLALPDGDYPYIVPCTLATPARMAK